MKKFLNLFAILVLAAFAATASAHDDHAHHSHDAEEHADTPADESEAAERVGDPWPLDTCVVAERSKLGSMGGPIIKIHEGREVRFCCAGCTGAFESNPEQFLARADAKIIEQQKAHYPLDHCIVDTEEKIDVNADETILKVVGNRMFALCCGGCARALDRNPARYIAMLDEAVVEAQRDDYPLETCVVSGLPLDSMGGAVEHVVGNQLVKVCCAPCIRTIEQDPAGILGKLAEARAAASEIVDE